MQEMMTTPFARKVKAIRKSAGLNQVDFAKRLGVDQSTVSKWELGKQTPDTNGLRALSKFIGEDMMQFDPNAPAQPVETPPPLPPAPVNGSAQTADQKAANARRRQALERVFLELLDQIAADAQDREELADPVYRRQIARLLAAGATAPLNPDVILGDGQMARHLVELWFHSLVRPESEQ
jgi:transcriptional regulator with XRE-family HTH domain